MQFLAQKNQVLPKLYTVAFDLGGVIFSDKSDIFSDNYIETELTVGIYTVIRELTNIPNIKLIILSKAFPTNAKKSREILRMYNLDHCFTPLTI